VVLKTGLLTADTVSNLREFYCSLCCKIGRIVQTSTVLNQAVMNVNCCTVVHRVNER
jgi:hypothetical protein